MNALISSLIGLMLTGSVVAAELFGNVDAISGSATLSDNSGQPVQLKQDQQVFVGATINTSRDGEIHIATIDGGIVAIRPNSVFQIDEYIADGENHDKVSMSLLKGALRSITGWIGKHNPSAYRLATPNSVIGIRGTDHEVTIIEESEDDEAGTYESVNEGATEISTAQGDEEVHPGMFAFAPRDRASKPLFLAKHPNFLAKRQLRIEERIKKRKQFFQDRLDGLRSERIKQFKALRGEKAEQRRLNNREQTKELRRDKREERRERLQEKRQRNDD
ncbi:MAG: FecR domain-containing protein [Methylophilaceae bacterium]